VLFKIALAAAFAGAVMFYLGVRRQAREDVFNVPIISPMALQIFGGALTLGGLVVSLLTYMRGLA
jgi:hypothetical protein